MRHGPLQPRTSRQPAVHASTCRHEVLSKLDQLLVTSRHVADTEAQLDSLHVSVDSLSHVVNRTAAAIKQPHSSIQAHTTSLHNLHSTAVLLRAASQKLKLIQRLRTSLKEQQNGEAGLVELAKCAKLLADVKSDAGLPGGVLGRGIVIVEEAMEGIPQAEEWIQR